MSKNNSCHVAPATTGGGVQPDEVINCDHTGSVDHPGRPINYEAETASTMQQLESDAQSSPFPVSVVAQLVLFQVMDTRYIHSGSPKRHCKSE